MLKLTPTLNSFLLFIFVSSSPIKLFGQFYPSKINHNIATRKADSLYFVFIKNLSNVNYIETSSVKFDELSSVEIADSKYLEWLKKSSKLKQIEIPAIKFDEMVKISAVVIADSKYLEYIKKAEIENNKQIELDYSKFDEINKISAVQIADSKYFNTPLIINQDSKGLESIASESKLSDNEIYNKSKQEPKNEKIESRDSLKKQFSNPEINFDQHQSIETKIESEVIQNPEIQNLKESKESIATESNLLNNKINAKSKHSPLNTKNKIAETDKSARKQFSGPEINLDQNQSIEAKSESKSIQNPETLISKDNSYSINQSNKRTNSKWKIDIPITEEQAENIKNGFYIVNEGETLYRVSVNTKLSVKKLKLLNNLKNNNINPGSKLMITISKKTKNALSRTKNTSKWKIDIPVTEEQAENINKGFYVVNEGETLYRVSVNTNLSVDKLKAFNNLKNNNIYPGTKLIIK